MRLTTQIVLLALVLLVPAQLAAQYWGERVMEKSFEQSDFFFTPSYLMPYGIGSFKTTTPGLLKDPLLDVIVNPARLAADSLQEQYLYTDFRSAREVKNKDMGFYSPWMAYDSRMIADVMYYPRVYLRSRRELEPVFSGAYLGHPLPSIIPDFALGLTYQLVMQDEKYYNIPQDIYRSVAGYDYNGMRAASSDAIPIVDRYSGDDNIRQKGHFVATFIRYTFPFGLAVGAKAGRVMFDRFGSYGSSNLWEYSPYSTGGSLYANMERRDQTYGHWDLTGGLEFQVTSKASVGAMAGYLWGEATQSLNNTDSNYYASSNTSWNSFYNRSANSYRDWRHHGKTKYASLNVTSRLTPDVTMTLLYRYQHEKTNIELGTVILDTSYSTGTWVDYNNETRHNASRSFLSDARQGVGRRTAESHHLQASFQWKINDRVQLAAGAQLDWQDAKTHTQEGVGRISRSAYSDSYNNYSSSYAENELKDLLWDFTVERYSFQVPVFVTIGVSQAVELLFGVNRTMAQWQIDDVTLALFRLHASQHDTTLVVKQNYGERYTSPQENVTDVRTTFLAGLTVSPSEKIHLRLLMVPNFRDTFEGSELEQLQWWLGLTLTP